MDLSKKEKITNLVFKIIYFVAYLLITIIIVGSLIKSKISDNQMIETGTTVQIASYPLTLVFIAIIFGAIFYGCLEILGLINIIIAATRKSYPKKKNIVLRSSISIILPIVTYVLIIVIGSSFAN